MPNASLEEDIMILRAKAERLLEMATTHSTSLSSQLLQIASELAARADTLEQRLRAFKAARQTH
jgi:hypothetical protein